MTKALVSAWAEVTIPQRVRAYTTSTVLVIADFGITLFDRTEATSSSRWSTVARSCARPSSSSPTEACRKRG